MTSQLQEAFLHVFLHDDCPLRLRTLFRQPTVDLALQAFFGGHHFYAVSSVAVLARLHDPDVFAIRLIPPNLLVLLQQFLDGV